jgi:glycosyltransferase involved in cell wall biosynthesis
VYEVSRRLAAKGVELTIATTDLTGELAEREDVEGVEIHRVRAWPTDRDYYFAPGIYNAMREHRWDIVHCQGYHTLVTPIAMMGALKLGIPYIVTFHSGGNSSIVRNALRGVQRTALRPLLARAAALIGVSRFEADFFSQHLHIPRDRFVVVPNGCNLPQAAPSDEEPKDETLILSVGRLERYKGHHRVIAAMPRIRQSIPNARLRIVGVGPYESDLRQCAEDYGVADCVEVGAISASDRSGMASLLSSASVVTLLSEYEAHPIAVIEALSMHRPVLVADTSGLREFGENRQARMVPVNSSPSQVAKALLQQIEEPIIAPVTNLPTWDDCAEGVLRVYESVSKGAALCAS